MEKIKYVCPCLLGIEGLVANELRRIDAQDVEAQNGRVTFFGDYDMLARANICSRYAERVLILLGSFKAESFNDLFEGVKALPWENWIDKKSAFPVKGSSLNSKLSSIPDCQSIIKKAIVERLKLKYKLNWFEETGPLHQVQFLIMKDNVSIMIDTSGEGLHKRGYRKNASSAPIKETLAAAMVNLAHVKTDSVVFDPFCGSGTILIESAMYAMNIAPGLNRNFAAERWSEIDNKIWDKGREYAENLIRKDAKFQAFGFDIDANVLETAKENSKKAGVASFIKFTKQDIRNFKPESERGIVICNPPYGERLLDINKAKELYKVMGSVFSNKPNWSYYIISPDEDFEKCYGEKADKRRKLYNGMIKCQFYMYFSKQGLKPTSK